MIQIIDGLPDNVVGIIAKGRVTNNDCDEILRPAMENTLKRHDKVRLYYEIGCRFPGAAWENLRVGIEPIPQWERVAIVTDVGWVRHTVNALRFLIPVVKGRSSHQPHRSTCETSPNHATTIARTIIERRATAGVMPAVSYAA